MSLDVMKADSGLSLTIKILYLLHI